MTLKVKTPLDKRITHLIEGMVGCMTSAWASSFVTRASRKFNHLQVGKKVIILPWAPSLTSS